MVLASPKWQNSESSAIYVFAELFPFKAGRDDECCWWVKGLVLVLGERKNTKYNL